MVVFRQQAIVILLTYCVGLNKVQVGREIDVSGDSNGEVESEAGVKTAMLIRDCNER